MVAGVRQTLGSLAFEANVPHADDYVVAAIRKAGAVITGKTATPEFGLPCYTETKIGPPARTPWDLSRSAGGSSGGAAAAVAAGLAPAAQGSDGGGSHPHPVQRVRAVRDQAVPRPGLGRPARARPDRPGRQRAPRPHRGRRRAAARRDGGELPGRHVHPAAAAARRVLPWLRQPSARPAADRPDHAEPRSRAPTCIRTALWPTRKPARCWPAWGTRSRTSPCRSAPTWCRTSRSCGTRTPRWPRSSRGRRKLLLPLTRYLRDRGLAISAPELIFAQAYLQAVTRAAITAMNAYDAILSPTLAMPPRPVGWFDEVPPAQNFERQKLFTPFTPLYNVSGQPAVNVPLHWTAEGLPIGVMLAGRMGDEGTLISLSAQLEQARPWQDRHPPLGPKPQTIRAVPPAVQGVGVPQSTLLRTLWHTDPRHRPPAPAPRHRPPAPAPRHRPLGTDRGGEPRRSVRTSHSRTRAGSAARPAPDCGRRTRTA